MTKKQRALEVIERLKRNIRMRIVPWIMMRHGNCWSASGLPHNVPMQG